VYIIYLFEEGGKLPGEIQVKGFSPAKGAKIRILGGNGTVKSMSEGDYFKIFVNENQIKAVPSQYAVVFKVSQSMK
ncbi:MAG: hypothetical protein WAL29_15480, partial [Bacteroidales bacterium]